jgi:hypothetical protein
MPIKLPANLPANLSANLPMNLSAKMPAKKLNLTFILNLRGLSIQQISGDILDAYFI